MLLFSKTGEIERDMNEVPHPFVEESMQSFESLPAKGQGENIFHSL